MTAGPSASETLHASAVALGHRAVLILGPSGTGKSSLALGLMSLGCTLISDDRTMIVRRDGTLWVSAPAAISGRIEIRGIGILAADHVAAAPVVLAVDLGRTETDRLPPARQFECLGVAVPLVLGPLQAHFPAAIVQYVKSGRVA